MTAADVPLSIPALLTATISLPFVDRLGNGKTAFTKALSNFIGGLNGMNVQGLVPGTVAETIASRSCISFALLIFYTSPRRLGRGKLYTRGQLW